MGCINSVATKKDFDTFAPVSQDRSADGRVSALMREKRAASRRRDIFAESVPIDSPIVANNAPKSIESSRIIHSALMNNFLFSSIKDDHIKLMIEMMTEKSTGTGEVIITEGDKGDYFYVVESGFFLITVDGASLTVVTSGATFGELALLYNCPRRATITCTEPGRLWALDRITFRRLVATNQSDEIIGCKNALRSVALLKPLTDEQIGQLAEAAQFVSFKNGERIINKGEQGNVLYIIKSGCVVCSDAGKEGGLEDVKLKDGDYFGERALMTQEPRAANVTAVSEVKCIALDRQSFDDLLGSLREVIDHNMSMRVLQSIPLLKNLSPYEQEKLFSALIPVSYADGDYVIREGEKGSTFYIIKSGQAIIKKSSKPDGSCNSADTFGESRQVATLSFGNYFGEVSLLHDEPRQADVIASGPLECLVLNQAMFVQLLGPIQGILNREIEDRKTALIMSEHVSILLDDLEDIRTLGSGTFGRVKLMRHKITGKPYAMKIMNKSHIVAYKQQVNVMNEKRLMAMCHHPFILQFYKTFKDKNSLYLLTEFVQGGELFSYLHCTPGSIGRLQDDHARFYASHVLLVIEYLHERNIVYRDLKPENLLIDSDGYIKVVDFGFAKMIDGRTYTLCGTPEYLAPELVLGKGHGKGVDYWALGVLIYEMVVGHSPFAASSQSDQMQICRNIVKEQVRYPSRMNSHCKDLISKLLERDVTKRIGLSHGGVRAIRSHPWFSDISWHTMYKKKVVAPYLPSLVDAFDCSRFEAVSDPDTSAVYKDDGSDWDKDF